MELFDRVVLILAIINICIILYVDNLKLGKILLAIHPILISAKLLLLDVQVALFFLIALFTLSLIGLVNEKKVDSGLFWWKERAFVKLSLLIILVVFIGVNVFILATSQVVVVDHQLSEKTDFLFLFMVVLTTPLVALLRKKDG